jgi:hypothetical protein
MSNSHRSIEASGKVMTHVVFCTAQISAEHFFAYFAPTTIDQTSDDPEQGLLLKGEDMDAL